jgi:hypothetical protein
MLRHHREVISAVQALGCENVRIAPGGKHYKLRWEKDGQSFWYTVACSPSDRRSLQNTIKSVQRRMTFVAGPDGRLMQARR